jgi:hypothetical protein
MKIVNKIATGETVYYQSPDFEAGVGIQNAIMFYGGVASDYEEVVVESIPPKAPLAVTMRQARLALLQAGLLTQVDSAIAAMLGPEGDAARITWEFSSMVDRDQPLVQSIGTSLGMNDAALDNLFIIAASL